MPRHDNSFRLKLAGRALLALLLTAAPGALSSVRRA